MKHKLDQRTNISVFLNYRFAHSRLTFWRTWMAYIKGRIFYVAPKTVHKCGPSYFENYLSQESYTDVVRFLCQRLMGRILLCRLAQFNRTGFHCNINLFLSEISFKQSFKRQLINSMQPLLFILIYFIIYPVNLPVWF